MGPGPNLGGRGTYEAGVEGSDLPHLGGVGPRPSLPLLLNFLPDWEKGSCRVENCGGSDGWRGEMRGGEGSDSKSAEEWG